MLIIDIFANHSLNMVLYKDLGKTVVILTYCRPDNLRALVGQTEDNIHEFGHEKEGWGITVVDDSPPEYAAQNKRVLAEHKGELPVFYFGPDDFMSLAADVPCDLYSLFEGHGAADARNIAALVTADKTVITLDDDMRLTETVSDSTSDVEYPSLLSTGEFYPVGIFEEVCYERAVDLVKALTSHIGRRVREAGIRSELMGHVTGNRDEQIDKHLSGTNGTEDYAFCAIEPGYINPDARILWQGVAAITGKTDCHATASIQGLGSEAALKLTPEQYGNLSVNYAVHDRERRTGLTVRWKESTLAAFGMLNKSPLPALPLRRGQDVSYRQLIGPENPVAISSYAINHARSSTGRPNLSRIYFHELIGAKACKSWSGAIIKTNGRFSLARPIAEVKMSRDSKRGVHRSIKKTCDILESVRGNGNPTLASYAGELLQEIGTIFYPSSPQEENFWANGEFKDVVLGVAERQFSELTRTLYDIFEEWPKLVGQMRTRNIPITKIK